ncbi:hypothetical protein FB567DRAFT_43786 [Paraphoma chrysanthemicola]|uniref:Uncharacterized protein n=1 Tax=Paraphoma chrysanthemicola TaxID=798071 RepID=A0A8K0RLD4_9PLEO|nr:hypothetical protein FB567DRAFT_43786 [Paraphoma chrysanthemicola]
MDESTSQFLQLFDEHEETTPSQPLQLHPKAPRLSVQIETSPTVEWDAVLDVTIKVQYAPESLIHQNEPVKPCIFHTYDLCNPDNFQFERFVDGSWEPCEKNDDGGCSFRIVDDPDLAIHVSQDEDFESLSPGETWRTSNRIQGDWWTTFPTDARNGDRFRYYFIGVTLDWWDWGSKAEHEETVVMLPCWIAGHVTEPVANGGRPKLVVPASEAVEILYKARSEGTWLELFWQRENASQASLR